MILREVKAFRREWAEFLMTDTAVALLVDERIELFEVVSISAGIRGLQILLAPAEYLRATGARLGPIAALE